MPTQPLDQTNHQLGPSLDPTQYQSDDTTYHEAYALFAKRHPNLASVSSWPMPSKALEYIKYCEWAIWQVREKKNARCWDEWLLEFYVKLVTSKTIMDVCQKRCKSSRHADALMSLLFQVSDRIVSEEKTGCYVFNLGDQRDRHERQKRKASQKLALRELRRLQNVKKAVGELKWGYSLRTESGKRVTLKQIIEDCEVDLVCMTWDPDERAKIAGKPIPSEEGYRKLGLSVPVKTKSNSGRPQFNNASRNIYFSLVERFVQNAYRGHDHLEKAVAIIDHFSPGLLTRSDANALASRLKAFRESRNDDIRAIDTIRYFEDLYLNREPFSTYVSDQFHIPHPTQS